MCTFVCGCAYTCACRCGGQGFALCAHTHVAVLSYAAPVEARGLSQEFFLHSFSPFILLRQGTFIELNTCCCIWTDWPTSFRDPPIPLPSNPSIRVTLHLFRDLFLLKWVKKMGPRDPNSGPHICTASHLPKFHLPRALDFHKGTRLGLLTPAPLDSIRLLWDYVMF